MEKRSPKWKRPLSWIIAFLLGLVGVLLYPVLILILVGFVGPTLPAGAQDFRSLQVWPDRSSGVISGLLEDLGADAATQVLPLGAYRTSEGDVVHARTYLYFPLDVFPPGTEIVRATLYMYVDGSSDMGETTLGVYRALEPWEKEDLGSDPTAWPALLTSPLAATTVHFDVVTLTLPVPTAVPVPTSTPTLTPTVTPTSPATLTPTPFTSPLSTPTPSPIPPPRPAVSLGQVAETWLTWDVTALMRAWLAGEVPNDGLALASAPDPAADPTTDDLLVARWLAASDSNTRPHIIAEFEVRPVTPTPTSPPPTPTSPTSPLPTPTSVPGPVLPPAGSPMGWWVVGLMFLGGALLVLGLVGRRK